MPVLDGFLTSNLWFRNARAIFPSVIQVCTIILAKGAWPVRHGVVKIKSLLIDDSSAIYFDVATRVGVQTPAARTDASVTAQTVEQRRAAG